MEKLKKGTRVMVYQDPLTEKRPEGFAVLTKHSKSYHEGDLGEFWYVRFGKEKETFLRFVCAKNIKPKQ